MTIGVHDYRLSNSIAVATIVGITQKYDALVALRATFQWFVKIGFRIHFATCVWGVSMALQRKSACAPMFLLGFVVAALGGHLGRLLRIWILDQS